VKVEDSNNQENGQQSHDNSANDAIWGTSASDEFAKNAYDGCNDDPDEQLRQGDTHNLSNLLLEYRVSFVDLPCSASGTRLLRTRIPRLEGRQGFEGSLLAFSVWLGGSQSHLRGRLLSQIILLATKDAQSVGEVPL